MNVESNVWNRGIQVVMVSVAVTCDGSSGSPQICITCSCLYTGPTAPLFEIGAADPLATSPGDSGMVNPLL